MKQEKISIYNGCPIYGTVHLDDHPKPTVQLEGGCNEFWLDADEAIAVIAYLQRVLPELTHSAGAPRAD